MRLADLVRQGAAPQAIRRRGAEGNLPAPPAEKLEILSILAGDADEHIRARARETLRNWDAEEIRQALGDPSAPPDLLEFAARNLAAAREDLALVLLANPSLEAELQEELLARIATVAASPCAPAEGMGNAAHAGEESGAGGDDTAKHETVLQKISRMTPAQKIKCALTGSQGERLALVRDSNKLVVRAVLQSPKLSEAEVEAFASMKSIAEDALRLIAANRGFMKSYSVLRALVNNARAPLDVTLPLLPRLNERDVKTLSMNKNIPDGLRKTAARMVSMRQSAR
ncbi:MAG: hypothetical protein ACRD1N_04480 [Terriglobia bacterium]